ncbi:MAG: ABC transporter substrate-binding protein [Acidipropionibacterium jensenii]|uniref:ABC transporter substrate-binding protein n=1 Tax=Acidipropionibacterium jensenii TaxID=1749 RepID=UPI00264764CD|nr:ABC transporter substrate-binding protein [Acidipropionibacterium jensenii]MDN5755817.1 ABC transporter substrate-binding protein [Micrococcaceae bacterium]MDN5880568.1 ABC transporter substrate-binding protein [Micrococcaceae bacterium]MDN6481320.1 ABC transporter substrate-binding protein [Acidipropionibacterium jensenii]MDN6667907.1 ABC transporter substrate-binding protein [Brevibacterium sp.]
MKFKMKHVAALTLGGALLLAGCSDAGTTSNGTTEPTTTAAQVAETRTVTDHSGAEVTIPAEINGVAFEQIPLLSTYVAYFDGEAPNVVATSERLINMMDETILADIAPEALEVDTSFDKQGTINAETLLDIGPDLVFNNAHNQDNRSAMEAVGLDVVGFDTRGTPTDTYVKWLRLLEDVYGEPGKMDDKIAYGGELIDDAEARVAAVPEDEKRTALVVMQTNQGMLAVAGGQDGWFTDGWAESMNFINATADSEQGQIPVNAEQLLAWDPDVIFVTGKGQSSMTAAEILNNEIEGIDLSGLSAVQNGEVYSTELGMWNWFTPNPAAPVVANWLGSRLYPEQFEDVDLVQMTQDYYAQMYGHEVDEDRAAQIIDPDADLR